MKKVLVFICLTLCALTAAGCSQTESGSSPPVPTTAPASSPAESGPESAPEAESAASLPENNQQITPEPGDIILYQGNSITVYYDVNTWNFTRLGRVRGVTQQELKDILGEGDVEITFSLSN